MHAGTVVNQQPQHLHMAVVPAACVRARGAPANLCNLLNGLLHPGQAAAALLLGAHSVLPSEGPAARARIVDKTLHLVTGFLSPGLRPQSSFPYDLYVQIGYRSHYGMGAWCVCRQPRVHYSHHKCKFNLYEVHELG